MKKIVIAFICLFILTMGLCVVVSAEANLENDIVDKATPVEFGNTHTGTLSEESKVDYYMITLPSSGKIDISVSTNIGNTYFVIYNMKNEKIWDQNTTNKQGTLHLLAGNYYLYVGKNKGYGDYNFKITFESAGESFEEKFDGANNNTIVEASEITAGVEYKGYIGNNDKIDVYKIVVPTSGRINIKVNTTMGRTYYYLYNSSDTKIWGDIFSNGLDKNVYLTAGTYYFKVQVLDVYGKYNFNLTFDSANESFVEDESTNNNTIDTASELVFGTDYKGQLAINDDRDIYKIVVPTAGRVSIKITTTMGRTYYYLYNASDVRIWGDIFSNGLDTTIHLTAGTYYFKAQKCDAYGNYNFKMTFESANESFEENESTNNNSLDSASNVVFGKEYKGQLAINDDRDLYKIVVPSSGSVSFKISTMMGRTYYYLYNASDVKIWGDLFSNGLEETVYLTAGTYYFKAQKCDAYGNYTINVTYESMGASFDESLDELKNDFNVAPVFDLGKQYTGMLAINDSKDFYKFVLNAPYTPTLSVESAMDETNYYFYDESGRRIEGVSSAGSFSYRCKQEFAAGTYYLVVSKDRGYGKYSFKLPELHQCNEQDVRTTPATCTANGRTDKYCTICGQHMGSEDLPTVEHTFGAWKTEVDPVCNQTNGKRSRACTMCGHLESEEIIATDHQLNAEGICSVCGMKYQGSTGGCDAVIGSAAVVAVVTVLGAAVVLKKKKED